MSRVTTRAAGAALVIATLSGALLTGCTGGSPASTQTSSTTSTTSTSTTSTSTTSTSTQAASSYTMAEVGEHTSETDCWTAIDGKVYDVTAWINVHPGGASRIMSLCGIDGTSAFGAQHGSAEEPNEQLQTFLLGPLAS